MLTHSNANNICSLPFLNDVDCALGIAVKSYLDELSAQTDPTAEASREAVKTKGANEWFPHATDFQGDLQRAFALWDSVSCVTRDLHGCTDKVGRSTLPLQALLTTWSRPRTRRSGRKPTHGCQTENKQEASLVRGGADQKHNRKPLQKSTIKNEKKYLSNIICQ
jgi:hypothetical protein